MSTVTDIGKLVVQTPGVCGGHPQIAGTGVSVRRIVGWYKMGQTPEEIADQYEYLSLAQVYAALAYYHANRSEIEAELAQEQADYEELASIHGSRGGKIR